jgi:hypothetical protein
MATKRSKARGSRPEPDYQIGELVHYEGTFRIAAHIWDNEAGKWRYVLGNPRNSEAVDAKLRGMYGDRGLN